ncbi:MAG TPA: hypothetical protein VNO70_17875 [Blastocatellia bacterium]|nr:hypothetical protein [Blastocatellia bacterium]
MPPGQEGKISLEIAHTENLNGEVVKSASVRTNDPANAGFSLTLRAMVKNDRITHKPAPAAVSGPEVVSPPGFRMGPFEVTPQDRWIASIITGLSATHRIYFTNKEKTPAHITKAVANGENVRTYLGTIEDGKRYELTLEINPALKPGKYTQTVLLHTDNPKTPVIEIPTEVSVLPRVFAAPSEVKMQPLPMASDFTTVNLPTILVRKFREAGLAIKGVTSTLPFLKFEVTPQIEGQVFRIRMTIDKTKIKAGNFDGKIKIVTNDADTPVIEVPVQGSFN